MTAMVRMLLGIGNPLLGDDGAGNYIASLMKDPGWKSFDCGTVPENFSGEVRKFHPEILVFVDAADMNIAPGEFRIVPPEKIAHVAFGTHALPLRVLIEYLEPDAGRILFIGIQPEQVEMGLPLSESVRKGAGRLVRIIEKEEFDTIGVFGSGSL
jgi:hydrogenase 3 maturation protease